MKNTNLKKEMGKVHPLIPQFFQQFTEGRISRRDFSRGATLLGLLHIAACAAPSPTEAVTAAETGGIVRGGTLTSAMEFS